MGLWATIKGWLNIGGVKVLLWKYSEPLKLSNPLITGAVLLKTKSPKTVVSLEVKLVEEKTTTEGEGDNKRKKTETAVMGSFRWPEQDGGLGFPLELKPGEDQEQHFALRVAVTDGMRNQTGMLGKVNKLASWVSSDGVKYFIVAEAKVKGAAFAAGDKHPMPISE